MTQETIKTKYCPEEHLLNAYLTDGLKDTERETVEKHIASCPYCIYRIAEAYEVLGQRQPQKLLEDFMNLIKKTNIWLVSCVFMFIMSFIFPRYFMQFLIGTLLCGTKWIVDSKNTKMLIMIYEAWKHGGGKEAERIIETLDSRMRR